MASDSRAMPLIGTGLLWCGWCGFNDGSALEANGAAGRALINSFIATAAGVLFWMLTERALGHKGSLLGARSGALAGLVPVTPAAGNSGPFGAILLGPLAGFSCYWFGMIVKPNIGLDDSLNVFAITGIGRLLGSALPP